jgi:sensor histidine kinase YesM
MPTKRDFYYWSCQLGGWGLFVASNVILAQADERHFDIRQILIYSGFIFLIGVSLTHVYRLLLHRVNWFRHQVILILPRIVFSSLLIAVVFTIITTFFTHLIEGVRPLINVGDVKEMITTALNFSVLFIVWNILYFAVHIFENWQRENIENLQLKAANSEIELISFRSQMNPHFMFNALNSIKALIDEDPKRAKQAVVTLSGMLRNNLLIGRKSSVALREEMDLVKNYLLMEEIRFEERLKVRFEVEDEILDVQIPPFILQTIVENAVKHGISKQLKGGTVQIRGWREKDKIRIEVRNTGELNEEPTSTGIGLANTRSRLQLLYKERAFFQLFQEENEVVALLEIPYSQEIKTSIA